MDARYILLIHKQFDLKLTERETYELEGYLAGNESAAKLCENVARLIEECEQLETPEHLKPVDADYLLQEILAALTKNQSRSWIKFVKQFVKGKEKVEKPQNDPPHKDELEVLRSKHKHTTERSNKTMETIRARVLAEVAPVAQQDAVSLAEAIKRRMLKTDIESVNPKPMLVEPPAAQVIEKPSHQVLPTVPVVSNEAPPLSESMDMIFNTSSAWPVYKPQEASIVQTQIESAQGPEPLSDPKQAWDLEPARNPEQQARVLGLARNLKPAQNPEQAQVPELAQDSQLESAHRLETEADPKPVGDLKPVWALEPALDLHPVWALEPERDLHPVWALEPAPDLSAVWAPQPAPDLHAVWESEPARDLHAAWEPEAARQPQPLRERAISESLPIAPDLLRPASLIPVDEIIAHVSHMFSEHIPAVAPNMVHKKATPPRNTELVSPSEDPLGTSGAYPQISAVDLQRAHAARLATTHDTIEQNGHITSLGKFLLDKTSEEAIGALVTANANLSGTKVLSDDESDALQQCLKPIENLQGVAGCIILGYDGMIITSSLPAHADRDGLSAWALLTYMNTHELVQAVGHSKLRQLVSRTHSGYLLLADFGQGLLLAVSDNASTEAMLPLMKSVRRVTAA